MHELMLKVRLELYVMVTGNGKWNTGCSRRDALTKASLTCVKAEIASGHDSRSVIVHNTHVAHCEQLLHIRHMLLHATMTSTALIL